MEHFKSEDSSINATLVGQNGLNSVGAILVSLFYKKLHAACIQTNEQH